jgi:hypothetical protein
MVASIPSWISKTSANADREEMQAMVPTMAPSDERWMYLPFIFTVTNEAR